MALFAARHLPKMLGFFVRRRPGTEAMSAADTPDRHPDDILRGRRPEPGNQQAVIAEANCAIVAARTRIHRRKSSDEPCIPTGPALVGRMCRCRAAAASAAGRWTVARAALA